MKQLCSTPLISGLCINGKTRYRIFATDGYKYSPILGAVANKDMDLWHPTSWNVRGINEHPISNAGYAIPEADIAQLLSGVVETKENG